MSDDDLVRALVDLGPWLDHPAGEGLGVAVAERLRSGGPRRPAVRRPVVLAAAAVVVLVLALTVITVAPAREAVARWFGIGAVSVQTAPAGAPPPTGAQPVPGPGSGEPGLRGPNAEPGVDRARLQTAVDFTLRYPTDPAAGEPVTSEVDPRPPGGLVAVTYPSFTLVQVASEPGSLPSLFKGLGPGAHVEGATVAGNRAMWITGAPHTLAYIDRNGSLHPDSVRRAGDVLLWVADGVTYRIEGLADRAAAVRIGESVR